MKALFSFILFLTLCAPVLAEGPGYTPPSTPYGQDDALRNAERQNQQEVDRLIRREIERRRHHHHPTTPRPPRSHQSWSNCGKSYWSRTDALNACPAATAMKARTQEGRAYYYCDCEE
jgi:hypothetical protein